MKRLTIFVLAGLLVVAAFTACGPKAGVPKAGSATAEDMLTLLPKDASAVLVVDLNRAMKTEEAKKLLAEGEGAQKYREFVKQTGLDLEKDVYFLAGGLLGDLGQAEPDGAIILNARYNKDLILAKIKEETGAELTGSEYEGVMVYDMEAVEEGKRPSKGAFLDESNIAVGSEAGLKAVIDVFKGKKDNVYKNAELAALIKSAKKDAMVWASVVVSEDAAKKMVEQNPMMSNLAGLRSATLYFDYKDKAILAEINLLNKDEAKNKQIADFLTGIKALGGMASAEKPEVGELMNSIQIASGPEGVTISANIPEDLIKKLGESAKKVIPQKSEEAPEEQPQEDIKD